jgi:hypothetical protein
MPAPYWLDTRAYDPVAVAATLDLPMLFMQGERDYQLTIDGDLAGWRVGLADLAPTAGGVTTRAALPESHAHAAESPTRAPEFHVQAPEFHGHKP